MSAADVPCACRCQVSAVIHTLLCAADVEHVGLEVGHHVSLLCPYAWLCTVMAMPLRPVSPPCCYASTRSFVLMLMPLHLVSYRCACAPKLSFEPMLICPYALQLRT